MSEEHPTPKVQPKPQLPVDLRAAMRFFASAVTVVTGALDSGELFGLTVSAFTSLSLEPPLVLICIRNESTATSMFSKSKRYCVNILGEDQKPIAEKFSLTGEAGRFEGLSYRFGQSGSPIINDCIAYVDCKIVQEHVAGDHTVFIGEAIDVQADKKKPPLLYLDRKYVKLERTQ